MSYQKILQDDVHERAMSVLREMVLRTDRGSIPNSMRQIEAEYGLGYWSQWAAWYRREMSTAFAGKVRRAWAKMLIVSLNKDIEALKQQMQGADDAATDVGVLLSEARERLVETQALLARIEGEVGNADARAARVPAHRR